MSDEMNAEYDLSIHSNPDARAWARFFVETMARIRQPCPDEDTMLGWFANAMMAERDHGPLTEAVAGLIDALDALSFSTRREATHSEVAFITKAEPFEAWQRVVAAIDHLRPQAGRTRR